MHLQENNYSGTLSIVASENPNSGKGVALNIRLSPEARRIVEGIKVDTGVTNVAAMERLLEWFAGLDRRFRLAILNRDEETQRQLAVDALSRMAGASDVAAIRKAASNLDLEEAHQALIALADQLFIQARTLEQREVEREHKKKKG